MVTYMVTYIYGNIYGNTHGLVELEEGDRVQQAPGRLSRLEPLSGLGGGPRGWLRAEAKDC